MHARQTMARSKTAKISASDHCRHAASSRQTEATIDKTGEAPAIGLPGLPSPSGSWNRHPTADTRAHKREKRAGGEVHRRAAALTGTQWSFATLRPGRAWQSAHCARWVSDLHLHTRASLSATDHCACDQASSFGNGVVHFELDASICCSLTYKTVTHSNTACSTALREVTQHCESTQQRISLNQLSTSPTSHADTRGNLAPIHTKQIPYYSINAVGSQQQEQHPNY
ncbi:hypothetical protein TgHK011_003716 [Trichoderma gracile]|nr:hypothetical protein TgHK011_003716 [Trichoderma gracile]